MTMTTPTPWYKQFWPWFLLGLLFTSIFGSSTLAVMAVRTADGLVQEDYYEHGRAINMVLAKQQRAEELDLVANLRIDPMTSDIVVQLDGKERPERLYLKLIFPTVGDRDQEIVLEHVREGRYLGQAPDNLRYRWYLQLHPSAEQPEWRLVGEGSFPSDEEFALTPGLPSRG
ncbi:FixH family protein [Billgrantia desiderata]|uniref:FixH family protein n=1 Tax=Billgrantia desiderata TaxID=52021 RepID=A0AAW4YP71_9GAMM|nr:FixH family protein [Halomonas desiderata]MCE8013619.1 FixH family protein [Halomonas desiderata]MCE8028385.1 FixH family protein [Halomonas desiderata]MCE8044823.1 FixH family protein [Halomonas desiderata]MCE8049399.1 FixH family protein [Halomonas desiderata]MCE8050203.1 FixH family protein [Halomonas desiderata]